MKFGLGSLRNLILAVFSGLLTAAIMPASVLYDFSFPAFSPVNDIHFSFLKNTYITLTGSSTISGATVTDTLGDSWNFTALAEHNLLDGDFLLSCFVFGAPPAEIDAHSCGGGLLANPGAGWLLFTNAVPLPASDGIYVWDAAYFLENLAGTIQYQSGPPHNVTITITTLTPEPATLLLVALGLACLFTRRIVAES